jgi:hypothetical protein
MGLALVPALVMVFWYNKKEKEDKLTNVQPTNHSHFKNDTNQSNQKNIETTLNPKPILCQTCHENLFTYEFSSTGKLCVNCFEKEYGKILLQTLEAKYDAGPMDHELAAHELTGIQKDGRALHALKKMLGKKAIVGSAYLTESYFIFAKDDIDLSKRWEIIIPLGSVILYWDLEEKMRQVYAKWEATPMDSFGFGSSFIRPKKNLISDTRLLIPYTDKDNQIQEPEFKMSGYLIQEWAADLFKMVFKSKIVLSQQKVSKDNNHSLQERRYSHCFNCNRKFDIYDLSMCDHCITSFCDVCKNSHTVKAEFKFDAKYLGGHGRYPNPSDKIKIHVFSDRIEFGSFRIPFTYMNDIENMNAEKLSASRIVGLSLVSPELGTVGALWKKKHIYTVIQYTDGFHDEHALIFDFDNKLGRVQPILYDKMMSSRLARNRLLKQSEVKNNILGTDKENDTETNPFHILNLRFAKGEITKEQYEEMRKMLES